MRNWLLINRVLLALAILMLVIVCLRPVSELPPVALDDKVQHLLAYAVLAILAGNAFTNPSSVTVWLISLFALGAVLEGLQSVVPGRVADFADVIANGAGLVIGAAAQKSVRRLAVGMRKMRNSEVSGGINAVEGRAEYPAPVSLPLSPRRPR